MGKNLYLCCTAAQYKMEEKSIRVQTRIQDFLKGGGGDGQGGLLGGGGGGDRP